MVSLRDGRVLYLLYRCVMASLNDGQVVSRELLLHLIDHLLTKYGQDDRVTHLLDTTTVHVMPTMNPDGFAVADTTSCTGVKGR